MPNAEFTLMIYIIIYLAGTATGVVAARAVAGWLRSAFMAGYDAGAKGPKVEEFCDCSECRQARAAANGEDDDRPFRFN